MFSESKMEDFKHGVQDPSDDEPLMVNGPVPQSTCSQGRVKKFAAAWVVAGIVVGAVVTSQRYVPPKIMEQNSELAQKWECVHWTPTDNLARRANANERRLCENKATTDSGSQYVYKPFGLTCQGGCHCCTRQRWSCAVWDQHDLRAREANADERLLCENKQTALKVYKYKPNGKTCGNGGGCLCCARDTVHAAVTPIAATAGATIDLSTCSKVQVSAAAVRVVGTYTLNAACPNAVVTAAEPSSRIFSTDATCTKILFMPAGQTGPNRYWNLKNSNVGSTFTWKSMPKATADANKMSVEVGTSPKGHYTNGIGAGGVPPAFACLA